MTVDIIRVEGKKTRKSGHTKLKVPTISLDGPGRLSTANVMRILGASFDSLCLGMRQNWYPKPDGYDGKSPYWHTSSIKAYVQARKLKTPSIKFGYGSIAGEV